MKLRPRQFPLFALILVASANLAFAGSIVNMSNYQLTDNDPSGSAPVTAVTLLVTPSGTQANPTVMPADPSQSPLTIASSSTGFTGKLQVGSGAASLPNGTENEVLNLVFSNGGFQPGGVLNFSLETNPGIGNAAPTLSVYYPTTSSLSLLNLDKLSTKGDANPASSGGGSSGTLQVPEPLSIAIWAAIGSLGLARAGLYRLRREPRVD